MAVSVHVIFLATEGQCSAEYQEAYAARQYTMKRSKEVADSSLHFVFFFAWKMRINCQMALFP